MKHWNLISLIVVACLTSQACAREPAAPYSMVYYYLSDDPAVTRRILQSLKDLGITRAHALVYWWQAETLGGDYWKKDYSPNLIGEGCYRAIDNFVNISREMGITPSLRLGSSREWGGLWHPADPSGSIEPYAKWVTSLAQRYRGKIDHYVIGDEENQRWSAKEYFDQMFVPLAKAIRAGDPTVKISSCSTSSSPATQWNMELIKLGLPKYGDGIACNFWYVLLDDQDEMRDLQQRVRKVWPEARFYSNGMVYARNRSPQDQLQAAIVAQSMFNLFDVGWDSAPYYLYNYSITADTKENYGIAKLPDAQHPLGPSAAWRAFQTIAHVFADREKMKPSDLAITVRPSIETKVEGGTTIRIAPPAPTMRVYEKGNELFVYLAYRNLRAERDGRLQVSLSKQGWANPREISMSNYAQCSPLASHQSGSQLIIDDVRVGSLPTIIVLNRSTE